MSLLERIREILSADGDLVWTEVSTGKRRLRRSPGYYSVGIQVAPRKPILDSEGLQRFSNRLTKLLLTIGPVNVTKCYEYPGVKRDVIKTAALYYIEPLDDPSEETGTEKRITVTIYPCQTMAENMGVRGLIDIGRYECPDPCPMSKSCTFQGHSPGLVHEIELGLGFLRRR